MGLSGFIAVITALALSELLGYSSNTIRKGLFSFNSLLVGLGISTYFSHGIEVIFLIVIGSAIAFFITIFLMGLLAKYTLPFLSLPFVLAMWLLLLSFPAFSGIELNAEALYPSNMYFKIGGGSLIFLMDWLNRVFIDTGFDTYFLSLGAIFFQFNILAGVLIAIGLLIHSRINFLFSLLGFFIAYWFYSFLGIYAGSLNYTYYGFNFILSAIAIGGYFLIPSRQSLQWSLLLIPILVVVTIGSDRLFAFFGLSVFSLPFNVVVLMVLYAFKIRYNQTHLPILTTIQQKNPETNAYLFDSQPVKKYASFIFPIRLPFIGQWTVNQGHDGIHTHKDFFRFAWDFIIRDGSSGKEYKNEGLLPSDYFCFDKPVVASALGTVVTVVDTVEDNEIGVANTIQNWGNTVVIKHQEYLYSKLSHLKKGSICVKVGETVFEGQTIGKCGNSGRSPYPHLHFQMQSSQEIDSLTIFWPLSEYIVGDKTKLGFVQKGIPAENEAVANIPTSPLLQAAFKWNPGDNFELSLKTDDAKETSFLIRNEIDSYNQSSLHCIKTGARLYYDNNGKTFSALNYVGSKKSALFYFYRSFYKVVLSEHPDLSVKTRFPIHHLYRFPLLTIQDFLVPFGIFLKGKYSLTYKEPEQIFNLQKIEMTSQITGIRNHKFFSAQLTINKNTEINIWCETPTNSKIHLKWENKLA
jgi:urea transporter